MMTSASPDHLRDALGVVGGVLLAFCLVPQLWKIYRTRSSKDIDYGWTALYAAGLAFNIAYLVLAGAVVGWAFLIIELALILAVIVCKLALEKPWQRSRKEGDAKEAVQGGEAA